MKKFSDQQNAILDEWADRLESGKYTQGTGNLIADGKHCCLGVLLALLVDRHGLPDGMTIIALDTPTEACQYRIGAQDVDGLKWFHNLPTAISDMVFGPASEWPNVFEGGVHPVCSALAEDNDYGTTFPVIAASIRDRTFRLS